LIIYIACALTHVPREAFDEYTAFIHQIAGAMRQMGHAVRYALVDSDPQLASQPSGDKARLCYLWDRDMVQSAELVIAESSYPSIGLGIELQLAENLGTPIVIMFSRSASLKGDAVKYVNPDHSQHELQIGEGFVTLMALGLPNVTHVFGYVDNASAISTLVDAVSELDIERR
jgi:hypothetical protein